MSKVLVTGGSGFLGSHCILSLLAAGHEVRTTIRSLAKERQVRAMLSTGGAQSDAPVTFHAADLTRDEGWADAVAGCDYVLHVASPFPSAAPENEDDLIVPARDGSLRVLRAARDAGVRRVVLTSSFAAVGYGRHRHGTAFTEEDWTEPDAPNPPYIRSKAIAERAAWDFMANEGGSLELSVVNPVGIFGPLLGPDYSTSIGIIKAMLEGAMPGLPDVWFGVVDVRDAAELHIRAMTHPDAKGQRFIAVAGEAVSMAQVADILRERLGAAASRVPTRKLSSWMIRLMALFSGAARQIAPNLGKHRNSSNAKARELLGWSPRSSEEALIASAQSLLRLGLVEPLG